MSGAPTDATAARAELHAAMGGEEPFVDRATRALEVGCEYLGVDDAFVARTDPSTDHWEIVVGTDDPDGRYGAGTVHDLGRTYCRRVVEEGEPLTVHDPEAQGWAADPAFETHGFRCYHGRPLVVDGETYGTVCFVGMEDRPQLDPEEAAFTDLVARSVERELELDRRKTELDRRADAMAVLGRVLQYGLRDELTALRGRLRSDATGGDGLDRTIERIDRLLDLSDAARDLDAVVDTAGDVRPVDLDLVVRHAVESVRDDHPDATFAVEGATDVAVSATPTLWRAVEELVENAAAHAGPTPEVTVDVEPVEDEVRVHVVDDGPGLSAPARAVLESGAETPLARGDGVGCWTVHWIVTTYGGRIETSVENGTRVTVTLPRATVPAGTPDAAALTRRFERARDRYRAAFEIGPEAMLVADDHGRFVDANRRATELFDRDREELVGRSFDEVTPDDAGPGSAWTAFHGTGGDRDRGTVSVARPDGTERTVEYVTTTDLVPGEHLSVLRDVTDRTERERELRQCRRVVENRRGAAFVTDDSGRLTFADEAAAELLGRDRDALVGEPVDELVADLAADAEAAGELAGAIEGALTTGTETRVDVTLRAPEREERVVEVRLAPYDRDETGTPSGVVGVARTDPDS